MNKRLNFVVVLLLLTSVFKIQNNNLNDNNIVFASSIKAQSTNDYSNLYNDCIGCVCQVRNYVNNKLYQFGSGIYFKEDNEHIYVLTNQHVIEESSSISIINSYNQEIFNVSLIGYDSVFDIAVLKVEKNSFKGNFNVCYDCGEESIGKEVFAIGCPSSTSNSFSLSVGTISGINRVVTKKDNNIYYQTHAIQSDNAINAGCSGGPLFDINKKIVGVITCKLTGDGLIKECLNFSIPYNEALSTANRIIKTCKSQVYDYRKRNIIGECMKYESINNMDILDRYKYGLNSSFKGIVSMEDDNVLGLTKYSVISKINGLEVNNVVSFRNIVYNLTVEDEVYIEVYKNINGKIGSTPTIIKTKIREISI